MRLFPTSVFAAVFAGAFKDPVEVPWLLSPFDPKKKAGVRKAAAPPFVTPASCTIFSSMAIALSSSPPTEELTFPADRDNITVQMRPQAVKTGISG